MFNFINLPQILVPRIQVIIYILFVKVEHARLKIEEETGLIRRVTGVRTQIWARSWGWKP